MFDIGKENMTYCLFRFYQMQPVGGALWFVPTDVRFIVQVYKIKVRREFLGAMGYCTP